MNIFKLTYITFLVAGLHCVVLAQPIKTELHEIKLSISGKKVSKLTIKKNEHIVREKTDNGDGHWFTFPVYTNSFVLLYKIDGFSSRSSKPYHFDKLGVNVHKNDALSQNIIHSDGIEHKVTFNRIGVGSRFGYKAQFKYFEPRFLPSLAFQKNHFTKSIFYEIEIDNNIDLGMAWFGVEQTGEQQWQFHDGENIKTINYAVKKGKKKTIHKWEVRNVSSYETLPNSPSYLERVPHVIPYIRGINRKNGEYEALLKNEKHLFSWYEALLEDVNDRKYPSDGLRQTADNLVKGLNNTEEKINAIFAWTQKNIQYLAFEYAMGGFIPRPSGKTFETLSGDCKDMSFLLTEMLNHVGIPAKFAWVGTRDRGYTYAELPTPMADNHAIVAVPINNTIFFLDPTNRFVPFGHPSSMIQGKDVMIHMAPGEFKVVKAPIPDAKSNKRQNTFDLQLKNAVFNGKFNTDLHGYEKEDFLQSAVAKTMESEKNYEIIKFLFNNNHKVNVLNFEEKTLERTLSPSKINGHFTIKNAIKEIDGLVYAKPMVFNHFDRYIVSSRRKEPLSLNHTRLFEDTYNITLTEHSKIVELPGGINIDNEFITAKFSIKQISDNTLQIHTVNAIKVIKLNPEDFDEWNASINEIMKLANSTIVYKTLNTK